MAPRSGIAWRRWVEDKKCAVIVQVTDGPVQLSAYQFVGVGEPECNPVHCRLEGSVDGQSWSKLHSQSMRLGAGEARRFPVSCRTAYSYFRFKVKSGCQVASLAELLLFVYGGWAPVANDWSAHSRC